MESSTIYELAYHFNPNLEEAEVQRLRGEIEQLITSHGGTVVFTKEPEKTRLSYPVKHERTSFFGWFHFGISENSELAAIDEQLRLNNEMMRHIILKIEPDTGKKPKVRSITGQQKDQERRTRKVPAATVSPELEKQLEEIIGGL